MRSLLILLLLPLSVMAETEKWYQDKYCAGQTEYVLTDGARVDCLTETHAIEFDFGYKWAECYGQAMYYAVMTQKRPGCVLIMQEGKASPAHLIRLKTIAPEWFGIWIVNKTDSVQVQ